MNLETTKLIEQYLAGELSMSDKIGFEEKLSKSKELQTELQLQKSVCDALKRKSTRSLVQQASKNYYFTRNLKWGGFGLGIFSLLILVGYYVVQLMNKDVQKLNEKNTEAQVFLIEDTPIENLKTQSFLWNASDTVYLSEGEVLLSVPENAFLLDGKIYNEGVDIQWQEALDITAIVKSGLSTLASDKLLETQGMFSIVAKTVGEGRELTINPEVGVYVQVPVDEYKDGMMLFEGEKDSNDIINWINPKPLEKIPVPVPMTDLNFYPNGYESKLSEFSAPTTKKYKDSLYLSFEYNSIAIGDKFVPVEVEDGNADYIPKRKITSEEMQLIYGKKIKVDHNMSFFEAFVICNESDSIPSDLKRFPIQSLLKNQEALIRKSFFDTDMKKYLAKKGVMNELNPIMTGSTNNDTVSYTYVYPSSVLGFWTSRFNNTILATREFEERMKEIHKTGDESVLQVYTKNLFKPLSDLDQMVVKKGYSQFTKFAKEQVGAMDPLNPHLKGLQKFYKQNVGELKKEAISTKRKQLGRVVGVTITNTALVYNLDKFTIPPLFDYLENVIVSVKNSKEFRQMYAYLLPNELESYIRVNDNQGKFSAPTNYKDFSFIVVGISENGYSYFESSDSQLDLGEVTLQPLSEPELDEKLVRQNERRGIKRMGITYELNWVKEQQRGYAERRQKLKELDFRNELRPVVFPRYSSGV